MTVEWFDLFANRLGGRDWKTFAFNTAVSSGVAMGVRESRRPCGGRVALLVSVSARGGLIIECGRALITVWVAGDAIFFDREWPLIFARAVGGSRRGRVKFEGFGDRKTMTGGNLIWAGLDHGVHGAGIVAIAKRYFATRNIAPEVIQAISRALDLGNDRVVSRRLAIARHRRLFGRAIDASCGCSRRRSMSGGEFNNQRANVAGNQF